MCGFVGINYNFNSNNKKFEKTLNLLLHRGPDSKKIIYEEDINFSLGFTRLSIQDISSKGMQPFCSPSNNIIIMFNGEIYNFNELKVELKNLDYKFSSVSDTEVLLAGYIVWGLDKLISKIKGMFAFSIIDKNINKLFLVRDRFGIKPLYYSNEKEFIFSSEIKPIISLLNNLNWSHSGSISALFSGMSQRDKTPYKNIKELAPGNYLTFDLRNKKLNCKKYFDSNQLVDDKYYEFINKKNSNELLEFFDDLLQRSIKNHMVSDVPIGSCFSAGLDSSLISAMASKLNNHNLIKLFCFLSIDDKKITKECSELFINIFNNDIQYIQENDDLTLIEKITNSLYFLEMPNKIESSALSDVCRVAYKNNYKVLLTGDAADEIFGGYHFHTQFYNRGQSSNSFLNFFIKALNRLQPYNIFEFSNSNPINTDYFYQPSHLELMELPINLLLNKDNRLEEWNKNKKSYSFIKNEVEQNTQAFLLNGLDHKLGKYLHRSDRYGMSNSVELRIPYLDEEFVKASLNLSLKNKMSFSFLKRKSENKKILRLLSKFNKVPNKIIHRKKIGTNMKYKKDMIKICQNANFNHCAEILKLDKKIIKYNLLNSKGENMDYFQYNFISMEILGRLLLEGENRENIINSFM